MLAKLGDRGRLDVTAADIRPESEDAGAGGERERDAKMSADGRRSSFFQNSVNLINVRGDDDVICGDQFLVLEQPPPRVSNVVVKSLQPKWITRSSNAWSSL
jgi:hypothetical protein